uniref:Uncharacterized protein n=1 Tax=Acrobeloides nanus TaxID=290746 RepID=A0A914DL03_9BILA
MSCPSGYQSLGISCQAVFTCIQATTSPVACLNGMCCLTSNDNRNFNPETCPNGGQSIGISCHSFKTCLQATPLPVACLNGMCCLTSNGNRNFSPETCPNGAQSIGISCQSVTTCLQATPLPVACQNGMCCLISSTTDRFGIENAGHWNLPNFNPGTCPNGGQSIGMSCQSVTTCLQAITSSVACQHGMCCLISSMSNGNGIGSFNTGICPNGGQSIGISCQSVTTCLQAITSSVACQHGMCCLISGVLPSIGNGVTFNTGICPIGYQALGRSCQYVSACQAYVGSASSNPVICLNGECCLALTSNDGTVLSGNVG